MKKIKLILLLIILVISNNCFNCNCLFIRNDDDIIKISEKKQCSNCILNHYRNAYYNNECVYNSDNKKESFIPHRNEKEIIDIVFCSIKNITQLARCKLDKQTYVRYNIA